MFKKLISNLPFNPSLFDQVSFYAARMRADASIRRVGFIFMALAFTVQLAAAMYPSQKSLATSPNDVLQGANSKSDLLKNWDSNAGNVQEVYGRFGITRASLAGIKSEAPDTKIKSTDADYWTVGQRPLSDYGVSSNTWGERSVNTGSKTVYQRPLHALDTHTSSSSYDTFHAKASDGADVYIIKGCGNPTFHGPHIPAPPKAKLAVHKSLITGATAHPGDTVKFRLEYQNTAKDSLATSFMLSDVIDSHLDFVSLTDLSGKNGNTVYITHGNTLGYTATPYTATLEVKVKSTATAGTVICNSASASSVDSSTTSPEKPCLTVVVNKPPPTSKPYCVATATLVKDSKKEALVHTQVYDLGSSKVTSYTYDVDANGSLDYTDKTAEVPHDKTIVNLPPGLHKIQVNVVLSDGTILKCCPAEVHASEDARVTLSKSVINVTGGSANANGTTIKSGDVLEFKIKTENVTSTDYLNFKGSDYFGSVLQYADIADPTALAQQGMSLDASKNLIWTSAKIKAKETEVKTVRVKVKQIVPSTNTPSTVSPDYNCKISNNYGNQVTMNVDCPIVKNISVATTTLPNTGPGTSVMIGAVVTMIVGYLYARSRLISRELSIVRQNYVSAGAGE